MRRLQTLEMQSKKEGTTRDELIAAMHTTTAKVALWCANSRRIAVLFHAALGASGRRTCARGAGKADTGA
jgi:hypothetical protein